MIRKKVFIFLFFFISKFISAQEIIQPYDFPIKPGTENWRSLKTHKEMVQVCQIPEDVLQKLTTPALMETCLSYPLLLDVLAFNNLIEGIEQTISNFNGFQILVERPDFAESLVKYYQEVDARIVDTLPTDVMKGYFSITLSITELLFGTQHFLNKGLTVDHKKLLKLLLDKLETKEKYTDIYGMMGKVSSVYAMIHVLGISSPNVIEEKADLINFKSQLLLTDTALLNDIIIIVKNNLQ